MFNVNKVIQMKPMIHHNTTIFQAKKKTIQISSSLKAIYFIYIMCVGYLLSKGREKSNKLFTENMAITYTISLKYESIRGAFVFNITYEKHSTKYHINKYYKNFND